MEGCEWGGSGTAELGYGTDKVMIVMGGEVKNSGKNSIT